MNRQQLQAEIKALKLAGKIEKSFDARQSNTKLAVKIAQVKAQEPKNLTADHKPGILQVVKKNFLVNNTEAEAITDLIIKAGNKAAQKRTAVEKMLIAKFLKVATQAA